VIPLIISERFRDGVYDEALYKSTFSTLLYSLYDIVRCASFVGQTFKQFTAFCTVG